jgi:hypothetical protein
MNAYDCPKRIDVHAQLGEIFELGRVTLKLDGVVV